MKGKGNVAPIGAKLFILSNKCIDLITKLRVVAVDLHTCYYTIILVQVCSNENDTDTGDNLKQCSLFINCS